ncbi:MAG: hypothetical protein ACXVZW_10410 [Gaiellaceae bacterium]
MATAAENIESARAQLAAGNVKGAAGLLGDAVYATSEAALLGQIRELAHQGLDQAGRFAKGTWRHIAEEAEARLARAESAPV